KRWRMFAVIAGGLVVMGFMAQQLQGFVNPCTKESRYYCIRVVDADAEVDGTAKSLVLDHMTHSTNYQQDPELLLVPYVHIMDELFNIYFDDSQLLNLRLFFGGGGGYTHPRAMRSRFPDSSITVAEIDPAVTTTVEVQMFVDTDTMRVFHEDARQVLNRLDEKFDVVVTDVFHDLAVPYHLTTHEYARLVKSRLTEDGLYLLNVVDVFPDPRLVKAFIKSLQKDFDYVNVWMEPPPEQTTRLTYVISASDKNILPDTVVAQSGIDRVWFKATEPILSTGTSMEMVTELSDDFAPVESLVSRLFVTEVGL
ncbi:MAG: fused MFS/spermidine synthase, partial [Gammaproteobacteria bacterium]|nr:fused MFS/spermidine synthase [Gammaproteobacteria bacterium]